MNKKIYICIISIITVFCIIYGTISNFSGWLGHSVSDMSILFGVADGYTKDNEIGQGRINFSETWEPFTSIKIDASVLDIQIKTGEEYHISYDCVSYLTPEIHLQNSTLVIEQPSVPKLNQTSNNCTMNITVPADVTLKHTDIQTDVGNVSLSGITSDRATLQADVGNIEADVCIFLNTVAEANVGAITFDNCELTEGELSADVGAITLEECTFTDLELSGDMGDITVHTPLDLSDYYLDFSVDLGSLTVNGNTYKRNYEQEGSGPKRLEIENSLGNAKVSYLIP